MAIEVERDPRIYAVDDDPMRASVVRNGARAVPTIADPAPLGRRPPRHPIVGPGVVRQMVRAPDGPAARAG